jgi:hypothetical protein
MWDVDPLDWKDPGPTTVANRILKETRAGSIVLSHDIHKGTVEAMPSTLEQLGSKRFKFVTVSELIGLATPEPPKPPPARKGVQAANPSPAGLGTTPASTETAKAAVPDGSPARAQSSVPASTSAPSPSH